MRLPTISATLCGRWRCRRHGAVVADQPAREADQVGAKVVSHGRYVTFQIAEVAVPRQMFADILSLVAGLRAPPAPA
jgi:hypothetical protein